MSLRRAASRGLVLVTAAVGLAWAQGAKEVPKEVPQSLVIEVSGARFTPANSTLSLEARPGDIFFAGDTLRASGGKLRLISCADNTILEISGATEVRFEEHALKAVAGKPVTISPSAACSLPALPRMIDPNLRDGAVNASGGEPAGIGTPAYAQRIANLPASYLAEFQPLDATVKAAPAETFRHLPLVRLLEKYGLREDAAAELRAISASWPDAAWIKSWIFDLEHAATSTRDFRAVTAAQKSGNTWALLVGISDFKNDAVPKLRFAHQDAISLAEMLRSPRGGAVPPENVIVLTNQYATTAAIRAAIESTIKSRTMAGDTVMLFIASHGAVAESSGKQRGYVLTYDSDPEDLATTAIPMSDIRNLFQEEMMHGHRLLLLVDVCHAGRIGQIVTPESKTNRQIESMGQEEGQFFGLLAAQGNQSALEGTQFGGGHGAFSHFLLEAWNGNADFNHDNRVTMDEFTQYVLDKVPDGTAGKQIPKQIGDIDEHYAMALADREGITLLPFSNNVLLAKREVAVAQQKTSRELRYQESDEIQRQFDDALANGRVLPAQDQNAFTFLRALKLKLPSDLYETQATRLRVALENAGQNVLALYLRGEQVPQNRTSFLAGSAYFESAELLAPASLYLDSRALFCEGRTLIFDKKYPEAVRLLERSLRLDPERSYSYNALGIAYLERGEISLATAAFTEAVKRSPYWVYPLHNLALAQAEAGNYDDALRTYDRAMRLAPKAFYLPYNRGLLLEKIRRKREAEASYRLAILLDGTKSDPYNALGHLKASEGRDAEAERYYRLSLDKDQGSLTARHNLAVLLVQRPDRFPEAEALWRENLSRAPEFVASRVSLARALENEKRNADAIREYEILVAGKPEYVAARLSLARIYALSDNLTKAFEQLRAARQLQPENPAIIESIGDLEAQSGDRRLAVESYREALALTSDSDAGKRLRRKLR